MANETKKAHAKEDLGNDLILILINYELECFLTNLKLSERTFRVRYTT